MATDKEILEASSKNAQYILELEANIDELRNMLERGCKGVGGLLIQTSDQSAVIKWREESQELINKIRSK